MDQLTRPTATVLGFPLVVTPGWLAMCRSRETLSLMSPASGSSITFKCKLPGPVGSEFLQFSLFHARPGAWCELRPRDEGRVKPASEYDSKSLAKSDVPEHVHGEHRVGVNWTEGPGWADVSNVWWIPSQRGVDAPVAWERICGRSPFVAGVVIAIYARLPLSTISCRIRRVWSANLRCWPP